MKTNAARSLPMTDSNSRYFKDIANQWESSLSAKEWEIIFQKKAGGELVERAIQDTAKETAFLLVAFAKWAEPYEIDTATGLKNICAKHSHKQRALAEYLCILSHKEGLETE